MSSSSLPVRSEGSRRAIWLAAVALLLAIGMQIRTLHLGRLDNNDWHKYASSFVRNPVGLPAKVGLDQPELWRERYQHRWLRFWETKPLLEPPTSWWDTGSIFLFWLPTLVWTHGIADEPVLDQLLLGLPLRLGLVAGFVGLSVALARRAPRGWPTTLGLAVAIVLLAASSFDVANLSYCNSFFRESAAQVLALWLLALLAGSGEEIVARRWWLGAVVALLLASATVHSVLLAALAVFVATLAAAHRRRLLIPLGLGATVALAFNLATVSPETDLNSSYNALFYGLLPSSERPAEHLERLGLPPAALARVGHYAFDAESQPILTDSRHALRRSAVIEVALHEPTVVLRTVAMAAPALGAGSGYLAKGERGTPSHLWRWTDAPRTFLLRRANVGLPLLLAASAAALLAAWVYWRRDEPWRLLLARLTLLSAAILWLELLGNLLGDGLSAIGRHLFLARLALDQTLVLGLLLALALMFRNRDGAAGAPV